MEDSEFPLSHVKITDEPIGVGAFVDKDGNPIEATTADTPEWEQLTLFDIDENGVTNYNV